MDCKRASGLATGGSRQRRMRRTSGERWWAVEADMTRVASVREASVQAGGELVPAWCNLHGKKESRGLLDAQTDVVCMVMAWGWRASLYRADLVKPKLTIALQLGWWKCMHGLDAHGVTHLEQGAHARKVNQKLGRARMTGYRPGQWAHSTLGCKARPDYRYGPFVCWLAGLLEMGPEFGLQWALSPKENKTNEIKQNKIKT